MDGLEFLDQFIGDPNKQDDNDKFFDSFLKPTRVGKLQKRIEDAVDRTVEDRFTQRPGRSETPWETERAALEKEFPEFAPALQQGVDFYGQVQQRYKQRVFDKFVADARKQEKPLIEKVAERLPVGGLIYRGVDAVEITRAAKRFEQNAEEPDDYETLAKALVEAERSKDATAREKFLDALSHAPAFIVEWMLTGGAGSAGRKGATTAFDAALTRIASRAAGRVAEGGLAPTLARSAVGIAGEGAARTGSAVGLAHVASGAAERAAPHVTQDMQVIPGEDSLSAAWKSTASQLISNTIFSGGHFPGMGKATADTFGRKLLQGSSDLLQGVLTSQASQEAQFQANVSPEASALRRSFTNAKGREDLLIEAGVFGLIEGAKQGFNRAKKSGQNVNSAKVQDKIAEDAFAAQKKALIEFGQKTDADLAKLREELSLKRESLAEARKAVGEQDVKLPLEISPAPETVKVENRAQKPVSEADLDAILGRMIGESPLSKMAAELRAQEPRPQEAPGSPPEARIEPQTQEPAKPEIVPQTRELPQERPSKPQRTVEGLIEAIKASELAQADRDYLVRRLGGESKKEFVGKGHSKGDVNSRERRVLRQLGETDPETASIVNLMLRQRADEAALTIDRESGMSESGSTIRDTRGLGVGKSNPELPAFRKMIETSDLPDKKKTILARRLEGETLQAIADVGDVKKLDGGTYTRAMISKMEKEAIAHLRKKDPSLADTMERLLDQQAEAEYRESVEFLLDRGKGMSEKELGTIAKKKEVGWFLEPDREPLNEIEMRDMAKILSEAKADGLLDGLTAKESWEYAEREYHKPEKLRESYLALESERQELLRQEDQLRATIDAINSRRGLEPEQPTEQRKAEALRDAVSAGARPPIPGQIEKQTQAARIEAARSRAKAKRAGAEQKPTEAGQEAKPEVQVEPPAQPPQPAAKPKLLETFDRWEKEASDSLRKKLGPDAVFSNPFLDPELYLDIAKYVAAKIGKGGYTLKQWTQDAARVYGAGIIPKIKEIWDVADTMAKSGEELPPAKLPWTGTKRAITDIERRDADLPKREPTDPTGHAWEDLNQLAQAVEAVDPRRAEVLIQELMVDPRPLKDTERFVLARHMIDIRKEHREAVSALEEARKGTDPAKVAVAEANFNYLKDRLEGVILALESSGTESGRSLNAIKAVMNEAKELQKALGVEPSIWTEQTPRGWLSQGLREVSAISRALMTSFLDLSAFFRQGGWFTYGHPMRAAREFPEMVRSFFSQSRAELNQEQIAQSKYFKSGLAKKSGLEMTKVGDLQAGEEIAGSRLIYWAYNSKSKLALPLKPFAWTSVATERAFTTFMNKARMHLFDSNLRTIARGGKPTLAEAKVIADYVNVATGRGMLGQKLKQAAPLLSTVFFSPRYMISRFQLALMQPLWGGQEIGGTLRARKQVLKEYARSAIGLASLYAWVAALDDEAEFDWNAQSPHFGKIRWGKTELDPGTGLVQVTRLLGGLGEDMADAATGKRPAGKDAWKKVSDFGRGKAAPIPGAAIDVLAQKDIVGRKVTPKSAALRLVTPLALKDVVETMEEMGMPRAAALSILAVLGMGVSTYKK